MINHKRCTIIALIIGIFFVALPSTAPRVYGAATPCGVTTPKCNIQILSPGSGALLNKGQTVNSSFLVSFLVNNFTLVQTGRGTPFDVNTTTVDTDTTNTAHNASHIHFFFCKMSMHISTLTHRMFL